MSDFKVLETSEVDSSINNNNLKLKYLTQEKSQLEVELEELRLNNKLLRTINSQISNGTHPPLLNPLLSRN